MNQIVDENEPKWRRAYSEERALQYDQFINAGAMNYEGALSAVLEMAARGRRRPRRILELGAGTGGLTALLLERFPEAEIVGVDGSPEMLARARAKLSVAGSRLRLECAAFEDVAGAGTRLGKFDLVVSSFSLHHMEHERMRDLFAALRRMLEPSGQLLVADYVLSEHLELQGKYEDVWVEYRARGMETKLGVKLERAEVAALHEETKEAEGDNPAELGNLLRWLREASFADVDCHWKYYCYAVFGGTRST